VGEKTERRESSILEVSVDDAVAVKVVDYIKDGLYDNHRIMLGKVALCEDSIKELSASSRVRGEIVFYARLRTLVIKLNLGLGQDELGSQEMRRTMLGWSRPERRSISVQKLASFPFTFFILMTLRAT